MALLRDILRVLKNNNPQASNIVITDGILRWNIDGLMRDTAEDPDDYSMKDDGIYRLSSDGEADMYPTYTFQTPSGENLKVFPDGISLR